MNQRMQAPPPGPRPSGIGLVCIGAGTFSETATGRERSKAAAAMKRHHARMAEKRAQSRKPVAHNLPPPEDVRRWAERFARRS